MSSNLEAALFKLRGSPLEDLPNVRDDPVWNNIKEECNMLAIELSALKNHVFQTADRQQHVELLCCNDSTCIDVTPFALVSQSTM